MSGDLTTLKQIFFPEPPEGGGEAPALAAIRSEVAKELPKVSWKVVEKELLQKVGDVLDIGLDRILAGALEKYESLQEYRDPEQHPPGETALVPLADHLVESEHHPHVDLVIRDFVIGSLNLDVNLTLEIRGLVLKIRDGRILEVCSGSCSGRGSLVGSVKSKAGDREFTRLERETPEFQLPGTVDLGEGVEIPDFAWLRDAAAAALPADAGDA